MAKRLSENYVDKKKAKHCEKKGFANEEFSPLPKNKNPFPEPKYKNEEKVEKPKTPEDTRRIIADWTIYHEDKTLPYELLFYIFTTDRDVFLVKEGLMFSPIDKKKHFRAIVRLVENKNRADADRITTMHNLLRALVQKKSLHWTMREI